MEVWLLISAGVAVAWVLVSGRCRSSAVQAGSPAQAVPHSEFSPRPPTTHKAPPSPNGAPPIAPTTDSLPLQARVEPITAPQAVKNAQAFSSTPGGRFIVLDFETTGLSPSTGAQVIEISAREIVDGQAGEEFLTFVDPGVRVPAGITQITGITTGMLKSAPNTATAMRGLAAFIGSSIVVGHNIAFDRKFLEHEAAEFLAGRELRTLCTLLLARRVFPGRRSYKLGNIVREVGISTPDWLHRASADTLITAHLFDKICGDAGSRCGGGRSLNHDLLDQLQRVQIGAAHDWLTATRNMSRTPMARLH